MTISCESADDTLHTRWHFMKITWQSKPEIREIRGMPKGVHSVDLVESVPICDSKNRHS